MMVDRYTEDRIRSWLLAGAPHRAPDAILDNTFERTRRLGQSSPRTRWIPKLRPVPIAVAAVAVAAVVVASIDLWAGSMRVESGAPPPRVGGLQFVSTAPITGVWAANSEVAVTIERDPADDRSFYWRATAYDQFDLTAWRSSNATIVERPSGARVLEGTADDVTGAWLEPVTVTVHPGAFGSSTILSPGTPLFVDRAVRLITTGNDGYFAALEGEDARTSYRITALVATVGDGAGSLDASALRAAGTDYPPGISQQYLGVPPGAIPPGGDAEALLDDILAEAEDPDNPYDVASTMVDYLQSSANFRYDTDVRDLDCEGLSTVECFARFRRGYCQYYATTMAILLRERGIPARLVAGFLPGQRVDDPSTEVISVSNAHAWVEVYFPGHEWIAFDPTGGGVSQLQALPSDGG
jgi:transglutaminase-like putative cysteine protease